MQAELGCDHYHTTSVHYEIPERHSDCGASLHVCCCPSGTYGPSFSFSRPASDTALSVPLACTLSHFHERITEGPATCCRCGVHQTAPASSRPCNRNPCLSQVTLWAIGNWSSCELTAPSTARCRAGVGSRKRTVECRAAAVAMAVGPTDGGTTAEGLTYVTVDDSLCSSTNGSVASAVADAGKPPRTQACSLDPTCSCVSDQDCVGVSHSVCNTTSGTCGCAPGWAGTGCEVPLLTSTTLRKPCQGAMGWPVYFFRAVRHAVRDCSSRTFCRGCVT